MSPDTKVTMSHGELIQTAIVATVEAAKMAEDAQTKAIAAQMSAKCSETDAVVNATNLAVVSVKEALKAANEVAKTMVVLSLSTTIKPAARDRTINFVQNIIAFLILAFAVGLFANEWLVRHNHIWYHFNVPLKLAVMPVILVDVYLVVLLRHVVYRCKHTTDRLPYLPDRGPALFLLFFLYSALVWAFAGINLAWGLIGNMRDSIFEGFLTVATLEHTHFQLGDIRFTRVLVGCELVSVVLLIIVFFPLLVTRLAVFEGDMVSLEDLKKFCKPNTEVSSRSDFILAPDSPVSWKISRDVIGTVSVNTREVNVHIDDWGRATIQDSKT